MNSPARYIPDGYMKEKARLYAAIDRFFDTNNGWKMGWKPGYWHPETKAYVNSYKIPLTNELEGHKNVFKELARLKVIVCGGTINSIFTELPINDLDFYMSDLSHATEIADFLKSYFPVDENVSLNAMTFKRQSANSRKKWTVQLITKFYGTPEEVFNWFDFTITHGAFDFEAGSFVFGSRFLADLSKRRLVYSGSSQYPICAMYRTNKYVKRGYTLPGSTIMHIALAIVQLKIETYGQLKEQLMGIDTMYLQGLLDKYDSSLPVNYGEFIDEAFKCIDDIGGLTDAEKEDSE